MWAQTRRDCKGDEAMYTEWESLQFLFFTIAQYLSFLVQGLFAGKL